MSIDPVRQIADTVLYEGYVLYPYRASAQKNRSRWQFGVLMPPGFAAVDPSETANAQAECVVATVDRFTVRIVLRFLQVQRRSVYCWRPGTGAFEPVRELVVDGTELSAWDEVVEREVSYLAEGVVPGGPEVLHTVQVPGGVERETVHDGIGTLAGEVVRVRRQLCATLGLSAYAVPGQPEVVRLRVRLENHTEPATPPRSRDEALPAALVASHLILGVEGGVFISMVDAPDWAAKAVAGCVNQGLWPVLAGPPDRHDLILAAPIILYDHAQLAPESPADLYDATEIDEILLLRTLALTEAEKRQARATDPRAAAVLDRADALDAATLNRLHGTLRGRRSVAGRTGSGPVPGGPAPAQAEPNPPATGATPTWRSDPGDPPWWDPGADARVSPDTDTVAIDAQIVARGSRVVLRPGARRADAQDMFLVGRAAIVEAVLTDVDDRTYLAVTLADDPDADVMRGHGRYLYFSPDEVVPQ